MKLPNEKAMKLTIAISLVMTLAITARSDSSGGSYTLSSAPQASGGGASSGSSFTLSGTIGQPLAGSSSAQGCSLASGFWPGVAPVAPELNIIGSGGSVMISWPVDAAGFYLQHCTNLKTKNWTSNTTATFISGTD